MWELSTIVWLQIFVKVKCFLHVLLCCINMLQKSFLLHAIYAPRRIAVDVPIHLLIYFNFS